MVAREALRASPATKTMRPACTCDSSGSLRAMSAAMRLHSIVTLGRRVFMCKPGELRNGSTPAVYSARAGGTELLGPHGARPRVGTVHGERPRAPARPAHRQVRGVGGRQGVAARPRFSRAARPADA